MQLRQQIEQIITSKLLSRGAMHDFLRNPFSPGPGDMIGTCRMKDIEAPFGVKHFEFHREVMAEYFLAWNAGCFLSWGCICISFIIMCLPEAKSRVPMLESKYDKILGAS
ncbi:hypothetical protein SCA6_019612 [Theobroma cacao]